MKHRILANIVFLFFFQFSFSQLKHSFFIADKQFEFTASKSEEIYSFVLSTEGDAENKAEFTLNDLSIEIFRKVFMKNLHQLDAEIALDNRKAKTEADNIFRLVNTNVNLLTELNEQLIAGTTKIGKTINVYSDKEVNKKYKFEIKTVQIVIQDGFIQDILVQGVLKDKKGKKLTDLPFTNIFGIGFSSKRNVDNLDNNYLFINKFNSTDRALNEKIKNYSLNLGEVISKYDFETGNNTTDFSPANAKITIQGGETVIFYKDHTYKILEAKVFSDFLGFEEQKANGLLQIEVEKKFNMNTTRYQLPILCFGFPYGGYGPFEYVKLNAGITKVEDTNKFLAPKTDAAKPKTDDHRYTTPIDIINHRSWYVGGDINVILLDMPTFKSQFHFNIGASFGRTMVRDTLYRNVETTVIDEETGEEVTTEIEKTKPREFGINYALFYPEIKWHVLPEKRFGFYFVYSPKYFYSMNEELELNPLQTALGQTRTKMSKWINEFQITGYLYLNDEKKNGKLFARWRLNSEVGYSKNNFTQFQVGYAFYILSSKK